MKREESAALARKLFDAYNSHRLEIVEELFDKNSETVTMATGERSLGPDGARADTQRWLAAFPDMRFEIVDLVAGDDFAVAEARFSGTHNGVLVTPNGELAATGRHVEAPCCLVLRFENGKIVSEHDYFDLAGVNEQLGVAEAQPHDRHPVL